VVVESIRNWKSKPVHQILKLLLLDGKGNVLEGYGGWYQLIALTIRRTEVGTLLRLTVL
jgi:hypothetical protein